ncbi:MAG: DUF4914 family protein [Halanaerobiaceae bacterium]
MNLNDNLENLQLGNEVKDILASCPGYIVANKIDDLIALSCRDTGSGGWQEVSYDVPERGKVVEAHVCRVRNGVAANYPDPYMRRRDPDCMLIADDRPTDKQKFSDRFDYEFSQLRKETFAWMKTQELCLFFFHAGPEDLDLNVLVIAPANAGFFAFGLGLLQGIEDSRKLSADYEPGAVIFVAPPFRHTHFDGKQVVVHSRGEEKYEMFSYNLYPGPSAKKGVYGMLIDHGVQEEWPTLHCSTVQVVTPYDNKLTITHEGASGGGKSEMLQDMHRERSGGLLLGENLVNSDRRYLTLPQVCGLRPVADDMAVCHDSLQDETGKLRLMDAEDSWFVRVDHITEYGTEPNLEKNTCHPEKPLLFLNIDAAPDSTALIWEHIEDEPGKPCPNPRVILPRDSVPGVLDGSITVDIRSFGVRTPPCTKEEPSYGIIGLFHVLPPALAWLWRLVAPRGHGNPSIVDTEGISSEGVGSYWPFAPGRRVKQANILLQQILDTPGVRYILVPNQHIGAWKVGFMPQWLTREYLARRGGAWFSEEQLKPARSPLLGYAIRQVMIEGRMLEKEFLQVEKQPEVGKEAYDQGAAMLYEFFQEYLKKFLEEDLHPLGREIIECCLDNGTLSDYCSLIDSEPIVNKV